MYQLFLKLYRLGIGLVARRGNKAEKWIKGRKDIFQRIEAALQGTTGKRIWIHCASLGEFEQGRPVIEAIRRSQNEKVQIILTFFSPSGYEVRKDYEQADHVFYLPLDGRENAATFIRLINPSLVIFVKYEFWYYYLRTLHVGSIPVFLVSATFRHSQPFFKWYGGFFRKMLAAYTRIFVQNEASRELLEQIGYEETVTVSGDTRYDRVAAIAAQGKLYPDLERWINEDKILIAGSTWRADEVLLRSYADRLPQDWKMIIAPHEIHERHLAEVEKLFGIAVVRYSHLGASLPQQRILVIDNIGMLSSLYRYGAIAYVGGGFTSGIHNILEPAAFSLPVIFGPNHQRFNEAQMMLQEEMAVSVKDENELRAILDKWIYDDEERSALSQKVEFFMKAQQGATDIIMAHVDPLL